MSNKATLLMNSSDEATTVIKLIGMPPPDVLDPKHTMGPGLASSSEAAQYNALSFPTLSKDEEASKKVIDTIDADSEDPFTLDTFSALVKSHIEAGKDFIIARVLTVEEKDDQKRFYYNYYAAHQINRSLFRTQPEEGLLHRMKAKNPMNNLPIIGDVHYYMVRASDYATPKKESEFKLKVDETINKSTNLLQSDSITRRRSHSDALRPPSTICHNRTLSAEDSVSIQVPTDEIKEEEAKREEERVTTYHAYYYATDDDYLMRRYIREFFKKNAVNPEDVFLFTLFGASQHTGETFSSPLVSDPTNPSAIAMPIEQAVEDYLNASGTVAINVSDGDESHDTTPRESSFWKRLRNRFTLSSTRNTLPPQNSQVRAVTWHEWVHENRRMLMFLFLFLFVLIAIAVILI